MLTSKCALAASLIFGLVSTTSVRADAISDYFCANQSSYPSGLYQCNEFHKIVDTDFTSRQSKKRQLRNELRSLIRTASNGDQRAFYLPESWDFHSIPQDPSNPLTRHKVKLGKLLFHETALATIGENPDRAGTWSCASCHHAAAGFKSGIRQGIGEGGDGFGSDGSGREMSFDFSDNGQWNPDVQPVGSPTVLNTAYQDVMLWNGQFGNATNGIVNSGLPINVLATPGTPKAENNRNLSGLETQAVAGLGVHRMKVDADSVLQTIKRYRRLYRRAFPVGGDDVLQDAGLAIAAFERTVLANRAPFQKFLRGRNGALDEQELRGGIVFFGKGQCTDCHRGPALSSEVGATEDKMFFSIGFADFDPADADIFGPVSENDKLGRGGFTGEASDAYEFKISQLYNLKDTDVFGHGGSFSSVREVVEYKNLGVPQVVHGAGGYLDPRFSGGLGLTDQEVDDLVAFLENGLYDARLKRYVPRRLPSGNCFPVADEISVLELGC